jgi:hypothetical protein
MAPPSEQEVAEYRAALAELMARCLERIRSMQLPEDAEPLQAWVPDE